MAQVVKHWPINSKALSSNPSHNPLIKAQVEIENPLLLVAV
jgi:hypothetical protein